MFQWDKTINALNIPASKVVHLFRSMREVQLALPGVSSQQASAFLCQYREEAGLGTVAVFHLHKSRVLAFYFSEPKFVPEEKMDSMLDKGLNFVESMGFLLTDQDIHLLDKADQEMLWASLPLIKGLPEESGTPPDVAPAPASAEKSSAKASVPPVAPAAAAEKASAVAGADTTEVPPPAVEAKTSAAKADPKPVDNVDDLLAAVDAMRAKRPGLRARKSPPSLEEMARRRLQLRETVGRILASL